MDYSFLELLHENLYIWLIITLLTIINFLLRFIYDKSKILCYTMLNVKSENKIAGFPYATITKIALWNAGNQTINESDVVPSKPIELTLPKGASLINAQVLLERHKENNFRLKTISNIIVNFDYIDEKEGIIIEVIHTGSSNLKVEGKIKGIKKLRYIPYILLRSIELFVPPPVADFLIYETKQFKYKLISLLVLIPFVWSIVVWLAYKQNPLPYILTYFLYIICATIILKIIIKVLLKGGLPEGFNIIEEGSYWDIGN